jgi:hypothetical protein
MTNKEEGNRRRNVVMESLANHIRGVYEDCKLHPTMKAGTKRTLWNQIVIMEALSVLLPDVWETGRRIDELTSEVHTHVREVEALGQRMKTLEDMYNGNSNTTEYIPNTGGFRETKGAHLK